MSNDWWEQQARLPKKTGGLVIFLVYIFIMNNKLFTCHMSLIFIVLTTFIYIKTEIQRKFNTVYDMYLEKTLAANILCDEWHLHKASQLTVL